MGIVLQNYCFVKQYLWCRIYCIAIRL